MVVTVLLLVFGVPAIVWLARMAWHRASHLTTRIAQVQEEMARSRQSPYEALAEMMQEQEPRDRGK